MRVFSTYYFLRKAYSTVMLVFLSLTFFINKAEASHHMGGSITFQLIDSVLDPVGKKVIALKFRFRKINYRDCAGIEMPGSCSLNFSSSVDGYFGAGSISLVSGMNVDLVSKKDVTPVCPGEVSSCQTGVSTMSYGVEEYIYEGDITVYVLRNQPTVTVSSDDNARNGAITNASGSTLHLETTWNPNLKNSSPQFINMAVFYVCKCEPYIYNPGGMDPDGDSLVFSLSSPLVGPFNPITYNAPWSYTNPVTCNCPITVDKLTGAISLIPIRQEVSVFGYKIEEYRKGTKIGQVLRDVQIQVYDCMNNYPKFIPDAPSKGVKDCNGLQVTCDTSICQGKEFVSSLKSIDPDTFNILKIDSIATLPPGSTISTSGGPDGRAAVTFRWNPPVSAIGKRFTVLLKTEDDACPLKGSSVFSYSIRVKNCTAVPLNLLTLQGTYRDKACYLSWTTYNEQDVRDFQVERSNNGVDFHAVGTVHAKNLKTMNDYKFTDQFPFRGVNYYKITELTNSGVATGSKIIQIEVAPESHVLSLSPNPVLNGHMHLGYFGGENVNELEFSVYDLTGSLVRKEKVTLVRARNEFELNVSELKKGSYIAEFKTLDGNEFRKFVVE